MSEIKRPQPLMTEDDRTVMAFGDNFTEDDHVAFAQALDRALAEGFNRAVCAIKGALVGAAQVGSSRAVLLRVAESLDMMLLDESDLVPEEKLREAAREAMKGGGHG